MVVRLPGGQERKIQVKGKRIGWIPSSRTLAILKGNPVSTSSATLPSVDRLHKQFHRTSPSKSARYEWPDPVGSKRDIGRLVSLTYTIPKDLKSPGKSTYRWIHEFGDHGERGHGSAHRKGNYPERFMPMLQKDSKGNLYIKRMPGNRYYVKDWLYY
jgi:hypothetical protein